MLIFKKTKIVKCVVAPNKDRTAAVPSPAVAARTAAVPSPAVAARTAAVPSSPAAARPAAIPPIDSVPKLVSACESVLTFFADLNHTFLSKKDVAISAIEGLFDQKINPRFGQWKIMVDSLVSCLTRGLQMPGDLMTNLTTNIIPALKNGEVASVPIDNKYRKQLIYALKNNKKKFESEVAFNKAPLSQLMRSKSPELTEYAVIINNAAIFAEELKRNPSSTTKKFKKGSSHGLNHSVVMLRKGGGSEIDIFIKSRANVLKGQSPSELKSGAFKQVKIGGYHIVVSIDGQDITNFDKIVYFTRLTSQGNRSISRSEKRRAIRNLNPEKEGFNYIEFLDNFGEKGHLCYSLDAGAELFTYLKSAEYTTLTPLHFRQAVFSYADSLIKILARKVPRDLKSANMGIRIEADGFCKVSAFDCYGEGITYSPYKGRDLYKIFDILSVSGRPYTSSEMLALRKQFSFELVSSIGSIFNFPFVGSSYVGGSLVLNEACFDSHTFGEILKSIFSSQVLTPEAFRKLMERLSVLIGAISRVTGSPSSYPTINDVKNKLLSLCDAFESTISKKAIP